MALGRGAGVLGYALMAAAVLALISVIMLDRQPQVNFLNAKWKGGRLMLLKWNADECVLCCCCCCCRGRFSLFNIMELSQQLARDLARTGSLKPISHSRFPAHM